MFRVAGCVAKVTGSAGRIALNPPALPPIIIQVKSPGSIQLAAALLATLASGALGDERARLTLGGYVPPMQRVVAIQTASVGSGKLTVVLQEQNNSALGYTLTLESKSLRSQPAAGAAFQIHFNGRPIALTRQPTRLPSTPGRPGSRTAPKVLEIFPAAARLADALVLTVASQ